MQDNEDYDEDGFPILKFTPEEVAEARARMAQVVDCRSLAKTMLADRPAPSRDTLDALARDLGIDGTRTLTEIEGNDLGDTEDVADEPIVHALRYVPVGRWLPRDIRLMLVYGHGAEIGLKLAGRLLRDDPLIETEFYAGDLLDAFAQNVATETQRRAVAECLDRAKAAIWAGFDDLARDAGLDADETLAARQRLERGERAPPGRDPFLDTEHALKQIARIENDTDPRPVLGQTTAKQLFARYRPRKSVELVPLPDIEDPDYRAAIADPETFKFRRDTTFTIVSEREGEGVRLVIQAESAVDHALGRWFADTASAKAAARVDYGISDEDWEAG